MRSQVKFLEDLFKVYGVSPDDPKSADKKKKASDKEIKDKEKEVKKEIKDSIDRINTEIKEYSDRYDFYKYLLKRGRSKDEATDLSFGVNFEGEPNLIEHVKKQLQSLAGDKAELNLDLDFSVAQFDDIFKDMADKGLLSEDTTKALRGLFDDLRTLVVNESKVIDEMFDKYLGYTEKKAKLDTEYFTTREEFIKKGATAEVLENLLKEYKEAGDKLALEFKEDDIEFHTFVNSLAQKSIEQLRELLLKIDLEMSKMIDEGEDSEAIAALRAKVVELEKELKEQVGKEKDKNVDSYSDWRKLTTVLGRVKKELNSIGDSIGGVTGEAVNLAATLTTSTLEMIEGITNLADWSAKSTKDAAEGASKAIGMVEKASVVLAVISAAMQVLQAIMSEPEGGLSEYQRKLEEDRNALAREYNKILLERIAIEDKLFGGNKLQNFINVIDAYGEAARKLRALQEEETTVRDFYAPGRYAEYDATAREALRIRTKERNWLGKLIGRVDEYQNLEDYVRRVEGAELFNADGSLDLDIAKIVAQWDNLDDFSKKHLQDLIAAQEAFEEYSESMSQFIDETYGKLGDSLTNALVESFRNGSMAAEDFKKDVTDVLEDVAAQMVRMLFLQDFIDEYKQEISKAYEDYASHGDEAIFSDDIMRATSNFFNGMAQTSDEVDKFLQPYKDIGGKYGFDLFKPSDEDGGASQLSRQISGMREDQADQLGSYLNAIRDYTSRILIAVQQNSELYPSINTTLANCQLRLVEISANTLRSADNTDEIRELLSAVVSGSKELHVI